MNEATLTVGQRLQREAIARYGDMVNALVIPEDMRRNLILAGKALCEESRTAAREDLRTALERNGVL